MIEKNLQASFSTDGNETAVVVACHEPIKGVAGLSPVPSARLATWLATDTT